MREKTALLLASMALLSPVLAGEVPVKADAGSKDFQGYADSAITLDGSKSTGPGPLTYQWALSGKPDETVRLEHADKAAATFQAKEPGIYGVTLDVRSGTASSQKQANVRVLADPEKTEGYNYRGAEKILYKEAPDINGRMHKLYLHVFKPAGWRPDDQRTAVLLFHGGGWNQGDPSRYVPDCEYFASRGAVAITAEYRLGYRQGTDVMACAVDAKSAVRNLRSHAGALGIRPDRIIAGGESAGGHIAAATGTFPQDFDETGADTSVNCVPDALVLYYPVLTREAHTAGRKATLSPLQSVTSSTPPTLIMVGDHDSVAPPDDALAFVSKLKSADKEGRVIVYKNTHHPSGIPKNRTVFNDQMRQADLFLISLGFLEGTPSLAETPDLIAEHPAARSDPASQKSEGGD